MATAAMTFEPTTEAAAWLPLAALHIVSAQTFANVVVVFCVHCICISQQLPQAGIACRHIVAVNVSVAAVAANFFLFPISLLQSKPSACTCVNVCELCAWITRLKAVHTLLQALRTCPCCKATWMELDALY